MSVKGSSKSRQLTDDEESEGLALLIPDIQESARIVSVAVHRILDKSSKLLASISMLAFSWVILFYHCMNDANMNIVIPISHCSTLPLFF